jgi:hypothetical protein
MAYCKGFPGAKPLRRRLSTVASLLEIEELANEHLVHLEENQDKQAIPSSA